MHTTHGQRGGERVARGRAQRRTRACAHARVGVAQVPAATRVARARCARALGENGLFSETFSWRLIVAGRHGSSRRGTVRRALAPQVVREAQSREPGWLRPLCDFLECP